MSPCRIEERDWQTAGLPGRWIVPVESGGQRPAEDFGRPAPLFGTEEGGEVFLRAAGWNVGDHGSDHVIYLIMMIGKC